MLPKPNIVRVYEQRSYRLGTVLPSGQILDAPLFAAFAKAEMRYGSHMLQTTRDRLQLRNYVGLLPLHGYWVEIFPKLDAPHTRTPLQEATTWGHFLIDLLRESGTLPLVTTPPTDQAAGPGLLYHFLAHYLVEACRVVVREGLIRPYTVVQTKARLPNGAINWTRQRREWLVPPSTFHIQQRVRTSAHLYNKVLAAALAAIADWPVASSISRDLQQVQQHFPRPVPLSRRDLQSVSVPVGSQHRAYAKSIPLARAILSGEGPRNHIGQLSAPGLLFDMNRLFEQYVFRQLQRALPPGARIAEQQSQRFWRQQRVRADIVLDLGGQAWVLDTKWKHLPQRKPAPDDLRQLYVYQTLFAARRGGLIYPAVDTEAPAPPSPYYQQWEEPLPYEAQLFFVSVLREGRLDTELGAKLIAALLQPY